MNPITQEARPGAQTYLVHVVGEGLVDQSYVVERYRSLADGEIVPVRPDDAPKRGRPRPSIMSPAEVRELCPGKDEIIIATGLGRRDTGIQLWGYRSTGLYHDRRLKG